MQTWKTVDGAIAATGQYVANFWRDPATGALLASTMENQTWTSATPGSTGPD